MANAPRPGNPAPKPEPDDPRWTPARPKQPPEGRPEEPGGIPAPGPDVVPNPDIRDPTEIPETSPPEVPVSPSSARIAVAAAAHELD